MDYEVQDSSAFASSPYPGETVLTLPGMLRTETGQDLPDYPAYVSARHPSQEESDVDEEGYSLHARSTATSSAAAARSGLDEEQGRAGVTRARAETAVDPDDLSSEATARADTRPLTVDDVLEVGTTHASASASVDSGGELRRDSALHIGRTTVADQVVTITPDGVRAAGQGVALPEADPAEALEAAGVRVRYLEAAETQRGVLSAGIEIVAEQHDPDTGGTYRVRYVLGRAFAAAAQVDEPPGDGAPQGVAPPGDPARAEPAATADAPSAGGEDARGSTSADPPDDAGAPRAAGVPEAAPEHERLLGNPVDMGMTGVYLVIVLGALAMVTSGSLLRMLGVKTRWTS
ncbi:hypothetical protein H0B56_09365 [Haloechinothrix sp. YIM 98757]|uniref:Uncharacterized protein n=1 Tax=Haloechinothrix aidingensis TaxID=2752311 RepID=A0A838A9I9_9PSEU|nr:hypothetical protein [Haloechinothrix aidingensis]MBA0125747.1 hypothetical protein [Haloechinothrix aidingensis]